VQGQQDAEAWQIIQDGRAEWPPATFLATLQSQELLDLACRGEVVKFPKGTSLISEGKEETHVFLLLDAIVKVTAPLGGGRSALLAVRMGGDIVGEIAFTDGGRRTATVTACGHNPVIALRLDRGALREVLDLHPSMEMSLTSAIARKLRASTRRRVDFSGSPPSDRLARALLELAEDYGHRTSNGTFISVNLTQIELGTLIGVSEKTAQRVMAELRDAGLVVSAGRRLRIPDLPALRRAAQPGRPEAVI
jgi:CRP-like cAMP-binding protein